MAGAADKRADAPDANLRSRRSMCSAFVQFVNKTQRVVDIIWINYEGQRVKYRTLRPEEFCDVNTFVTHPWVFRDTRSHIRLIASSKEVYQPSLPAANNRIQPIRTVVSITLPVYSLRERCLEVVTLCLTKPEDAYTLDIPGSLQKEIFKRWP